MAHYLEPVTYSLGIMEIKGPGPAAEPRTTKTNNNFTNAAYEIDVILHVDVDSFECQVHSRNRPDLIGQPFAVSNNGKIVSISQEAKAMGVPKGIERENQMRHRFPNVIIVKVPEHPRWEKPDSSIARRASFAIRDQLVKYQKENVGIIVNYASTDEFFIDCSQLVSNRMKAGFYPQFHHLAQNTVFEDNNRIVGQELRRILDQRRFGMTKCRLVVGAVIANEMASKIKENTGYKVSVGISSNMLLAKLASPIHKPNGFCIMTLDGLLKRLAHEIGVRQVPGLKKSRGEEFCKRFGAHLTMAEAAEICFEDIIKCFGPADGQQIYNVLHGTDNEKITQKTYKNTVSVSKTFSTPFQDQSPGSIAIYKQIQYLGEEIMQRLKYEEYNLHNRRTTKLRIEVTFLRTAANRQQSKRSHSYTFEIDEMYEYISFGDNIESNGRDVAESAMNGLEEEVGFQFDQHKITNLKLIANSFDDVEFNVQKFLINWLMEDDSENSGSDSD